MRDWISVFVDTDADEGGRRRGSCGSAVPQNRDQKVGADCIDGERHGESIRYGRRGTRLRRT